MQVGGCSPGHTYRPQAQHNITNAQHMLHAAAGAGFGQELPPQRMEALIRAAGRTPRQRTTLYEDPPADRAGLGLRAPALQPLRRAAGPALSA